MPPAAAAEKRSASNHKRNETKVKSRTVTFELFSEDRNEPLRSRDVFQAMCKAV